MSTRQVLRAIITLTLLLGSCSSLRTDSEKTHWGGCILISPAAEAPSDLYQENDIVPTDEYNISDAFMRKVAKTIKKIFPQGGAIDGALQEEVLRNLYRYRVAIPIFKGDPGFSSEEDWERYHHMKRQNSICDIIMEGVPRQVMEVVEHILHHVTNAGLHYTFPDEWGISKTSKLYQAMQEAVDKGYYDVSSYRDIEDEARERVMLQEFAYLIITTAWDLQEPYGGGGDEWTNGGTIRNGDDLKEKMPQLYEVYEQTVVKVMASPGLSTLGEFAN